ncbi:MAG: HesA/MoeB/ThiF family protein [Bacteroidales bacterium]
MISNQEKAKYEKFIALPEMGEEAMEKLKNSKILVIGGGGLGSAVLPLLATSGVGTIGIAENDTIEISNLQRQILYSPLDIGEKKLKVIHSTMIKLNPDIRLKTYDTYLNKKNGEEIIDEYQYILDCTDNFQTRYLINDICAEKQKPLIYASVSDYEGMVTILHYHKKKNLRDIFPNEPEPKDKSAIIPTLPQIIGSIQANETIKVITNAGEILDGKLLIFNVLNNIIYTLDM